MALGLARPRSRVLAELWDAWVHLREVVIAVEVFDHRDDRRVRGFVVYIAPTGVVVDMWNGAEVVRVPTERVLSVRRPHVSAPEDGEPVSLASVPSRRRSRPPMNGQQEMCKRA